MEYWQNTSNINVDLITGKKMKEGERLVAVIQELIRKFEMDNEPTIIFTDESRAENNRATGSAHYIPEEEMGYIMSIDKNCSN